MASMTYSKNMFNQILKGIPIAFGIIAFLFQPIYAQENEKELFIVAQKAFEDGFYDVAMRYIDQLLNDYPQTQKRIEANLLLGQCHFFKNQYLKAYSIFNELIDYPEYQDASLFWLAETYLKGNDYKEAEQRYNQLIKLYPKSVYSPQAYYSLGWIYFDQNKFEEAKKVFEKLIRSHPTHQLTEDAGFKLAESEYNLRKYDEAINLFKNYILKYPKSTRHAESYFYIAESYYYLENSLLAITYYAKSSEIAYDHRLILMAKVSLGWSYLKISKYKLSQQYFDEALKYSIEKNILSDDVYLGQASLYTEMEMPEEALKAYDQLTKIFPNSSRLTNAYLGKANILYLLKKYDQAIENYHLLIAKYGEDDQDDETLEKAYFGLAWSYLKAGNIDQSINTFQTIKDKTSNKTVKISALTQIGDAYQDIEEYEKALEIYDQILTIYPESLYSDYVQYRQGIALLKLDHIDSATLSFQTLVNNFPESKYLKEVKYYLAVAYFKKGDWYSAIDQILNFVQHLPSNSEFLAESYYILASSYFNLNDHQTAKNTFEKIIKNFPEQSTLIKNSNLYLAKCLYLLDKKQKALKMFNFLIEKYPQSEIGEESILWVADHYINENNNQEAIAYYKKFIKDYAKSPKISVVYYELGQTYYANDDLESAIDAFNLVKNTPDPNIYAKAKLATAEILSKNINPKSAIEVYQNIISTSPEFKRDAYVKIAEIQKNDKDIDKSIESYKMALNSAQLSSRIVKAELQFSIGDSYELKLDAEKAIEEYMKVFYLYPNNKQWVIKSYLRIARLFEDHDQWEKARKIYDKIIELKTEESKYAVERLEWIAQNVLEESQY